MKALRVGLTAALCALVPTLACALVISDISVTTTGFENNGVSVFVGISPNTVNCLNGGVYFTNSASLSRVLAVAVAAKTAGLKVRIDYTGGGGQQCNGYSIYLQ